MRWVRGVEGMRVGTNRTQESRCRSRSNRSSICRTYGLRWHLRHAYRRKAQATFTYNAIYTLTIPKSVYAGTYLDAVHGA